MQRCPSGRAPILISKEAGKYIKGGRVGRFRVGVRRMQDGFAQSSARDCRCDRGIRRECIGGSLAGKVGGKVEGWLMAMFWAA